VMHMDAREAKEDRRLCAVSVRLSAEEDEKLERVAERTFRKKTDVVRFALDQFFADLEERGEL